MKFKTTKKNMKENYRYIIGAGYCNLQHLLKYENEIAYSTRSEGWACDYYDVNGVLISTGYAYIDSKNTKAGYSMMREYDNKAMEIAGNFSLSWEEQREQTKALLDEFIQKAIGNC